MSGKQRPALGVDVGTYTLVVSKRDKEQEVAYTYEVNGFMEIPLTPENRKMLSMIEATAPVYRPEGGKSAFPMGIKAQEIALSWSSFLNPDGAARTIYRRTMRDGILSVRDSRESFHLLATMLHSLIGRPADGTQIAYSFPGPPINSREGEAGFGLDPKYHEEVIGQIMRQFGSGVTAFGVNEAMAIIWAECEAEQYTGLAMSFGAGMCNVVFAKYGVPIFAFSYVGGGDWIDEQSARRSGVDAVVVNRIKMGDKEAGLPGIDLTAEPSGSNAHIERAIQSHYRILMGDIVQGVAKHVRENKARVVGGNPPGVIIAGGTSQPKGFVELLTRLLQGVDWGDFKIGGVRHASDPLFTVSRGLLLAAERTERE